MEKLKTMLEAGGFLIKPLHKNSLRKKKIQSGISVVVISVVDDCLV
ncbi:hypothetical protein [Teredinibacter turnerae]|nr:hypothetical protein [Teredinibacter turnerae]